MKPITAIILIFTISLQIQAAPIPGTYDEALVIAYDNKTDKISGYYENFSGWNERSGMPRFMCTFYLQGKPEADRPINIKTWYPGNPDPEAVISGTLKISADNKNLIIKLNKEHGGCWNVQHFTDSPVSFSLAKKKNWIGIRVARSKKTYFYRQPDAQTRRRAYVINGDVLKVIKNNTDWLYIEYLNINSGKTTQG